MLINLYKSDIPEYLKSSEFYNNLVDDEMFTVDKCIFRKNSNINCFEDFKKILLRFK